MLRLRFLQTERHCVEATPHDEVVAESPAACCGDPELANVRVSERSYQGDPQEGAMRITSIHP